MPIVAGDREVATPAPAAGAPRAHAVREQALAARTAKANAIALALRAQLVRTMQLRLHLLIDPRDVELAYGAHYPSCAYVDLEGVRFFCFRATPADEHEHDLLACATPTGPHLLANDWVDGFTVRVEGWPDVGELVYQTTCVSVRGGQRGV